MKNLFPTLLFVGFSAMLSAQTLTIQRQGKSADFSQTSLLRVRTADPRSSGKVDFNALEVTGYVASQTADSIRFKARSIYRHQHIGNLHTRNEQGYKPSSDQFSYISIAKKDVYDLVNFQSSQKRKAKRNRARIGVVLMGTGLATLAHTALVKGSDNRKNLLISGGVQFGAGLVLAISSGKKSYKFKSTEAKRNWRFQ